MNTPVNTLIDGGTRRKLVVAIIGLCIVWGVEILRQAMTAGWLVRGFHAACFAAAIWVTVIGVMRGPFLHYLWGWGVLIVGGVTAGSTVSWAVGWTYRWEWQPSPALATLVGLCSLITGYLLLFDPDIRRYRKSIKGRYHDGLKLD